MYIDPEKIDGPTLSKPFNSTRYIRNQNLTPHALIWGKLSTPHGTLGTVLSRGRSHAMTALSTPHGTLGTVINNPTKTKNPKRLSTPHGTLGTKPFETFDEGIEIVTFNSTRYIRNVMTLDVEDDIGYFQLHTVH